MQRRCGNFANSYYRRESTAGNKVARAMPSVFGLGDCCGGGVAARAEVEGDSSSGRRGYIVQEAVASFVGKG